jgi:hypothetical protein
MESPTFRFINGVYNATAEKGRKISGTIYINDKMYEISGGKVSKSAPAKGFCGDRNNKNNAVSEQGGVEGYKESGQGQRNSSRNLGQNEESLGEHEPFEENNRVETVPSTFGMGESSTNGQGSGSEYGMGESSTNGQEVEQIPPTSTSTNGQGSGMGESSTNDQGVEQIPPTSTSTNGQGSGMGESSTNGQGAETLPIFRNSQTPTVGSAIPLFIHTSMDTFINAFNADNTNNRITQLS